MEQVYGMLMELTREISELKQEIVELRKENEFLKAATVSMNPIFSEQERQEAAKKISDIQMANDRRQALEAQFHGTEESIEKNAIR